MWPDAGPCPLAQTVLPAYSAFSAATTLWVSEVFDTVDELQQTVSDRLKNARSSFRAATSGAAPPSLALGLPWQPKSTRIDVVADGQAISRRASPLLLKLWTGPDGEARVFALYLKSRFPGREGACIQVGGQDVGPPNDDAILAFAHGWTEVDLRTSEAA